MTPTRRDALKLAALLAATPLTGAIAMPESPAWTRSAMRWMQVAFTEDNPQNADIGFWLKLFAECHADGVCLSAGGSIAFYPSALALQHRAKFLGDRDLFGDMVKGCRALGLRIIARVDPHAMAQEVFAAHPEWAACTEDGKPRRHWAAADMVVTCQNGGFMFELMPQILAEITARYAPDGFFGNRWNGSGMCWCASCRAQFKTATGFDLPRSNETNEEVTRAYADWDKERRWAQYALWNAAIKKVKPDGFFAPNYGMNDPRAEIPMVTIDRQGRTGLTPLWSNGKNAKLARSVVGDTPVAGLFSIGVEDEAYRFKDSVQGSAEIAAWVHAGMAQGFRPWLCKFNAKVIDPRWIATVEKLYDWHWKNEKYFRNTENLARVAIVQSLASQTAAKAQYDAAQNGWCQALTEARVAYEFLDDRLLEKAARYRVLVLPNATVLSDGQCAALKTFVRNGGRLVATGATSLADEAGRRRTNFGLAELFGCDFAGTIDTAVKNSYLTPRGPHPLVKGLEDAPRVIGTSQRLHVTPHDNGLNPLTLVPSYPDLPMERDYTLTPATDIPAVFCRSFGKGRVVYFPSNIDATFWDLLVGDHLALLANAIAWAADEPQPLMVTGPGLIDVAYWRQAHSLAAHLVNLTNPMALKGPFREILPIGPFEVRLQSTVTPQAVRLLEADTPADWRRDGDMLIVRVPRVALHEVVAIDF